MSRTISWIRAGAVALALVVGRVALAQPGLDSIVPPSPTPAGFIADGGPVLDSAALARLNARIADVQRATGGDIAVAIVRDLHDRAPVDVGVAIYRAWKVGRVDSIGSARRALGALLLIVPKELAPSGRGECWIATGNGAEGELHDGIAGTICRDAIIPHLRTRDYEAAIAAGIDGIGAAFERTVAGLPAPGAVRAPSGRRRGNPLPYVGALVGTVVAGVAGAFGVASYRRRRPRRCPRGHGDMVRLDEAADDAALSEGQRLEERLGSVDYDVWACPACDERVVIPYGSWRSGYSRCAHCGFTTVESHRALLVAPTQLSTGLEEVTVTCRHCGRVDVTRRILPVLPPPGHSSSGGGGGGGGGGSSFGGSGATSGGGGGSSY